MHKSRKFDTKGSSYDNEPELNGIERLNLVGSKNELEYDSEQNTAQCGWSQRNLKSNIHLLML